VISRLGWSEQGNFAVSRAAETGPRPDLSRAAWGGAFKIVGAMVTGASSLVIAVILTRLFGAENYGLYSLGLISAELATQVAGLGMRSSALRFAPIAYRHRDAARLVGVYRMTCGLPLLAGLILAAAMMWGAESLAVHLFDNASLAPVFRIFALGIPLNALAHSLETVLRGLHRADLSILGLDIGFQLPRLVLTITAVAVGAGIIGAAVAHAMALAAAVAILRFLLRPFLSQAQGCGVDYRADEIWSQAAPMYLTRMLQAFGGRLETLVLGILGLTSGVGVFAAALQLTRIPEILRRALFGVTTPLVSEAFEREGGDQFVHLVHAVSRWSTQITLPFVVIAVLFTGPVLSVFGEEFRAGQVGLILLICIPLLDSVAGLCTAVLAMTGNARLNTLNSLAFLAAKIGLDLLLIPLWGVSGAAGAALGAVALLSALRVAETYWIFRIWPVDRSILKPFLAACAATVAGSGVVFGLPGLEEIRSVLLGTACVSVTYVACVLALGLSEDDRRLVKRLGRRIAVGQSRGRKTGRSAGDGIRRRDLDDRG